MPAGVCRGSAMVGGSGTRHGLLENANPLIYERSGERPVTAGEEDEQVPDSIDAREIFDIRCCRARAGSQGPGRGHEVMLVELCHVQTFPEGGSEWAKAQSPLSLTCHI